MTEKQTKDALEVIKKDAFRRWNSDSSYSEFYLAAFIPTEAAKRKGCDIRYYNHVDCSLPLDKRTIKTDVIVIPYKNYLGKYPTNEPTAYQSYESAIKKLEQWRRNPCPKEFLKDSYLGLLLEPEAEFKVVEIKVKKYEHYEHVIC